MPGQAPARAAKSAGPSASGAGAISLGDGLKREFNFAAITNEDGSVSGRLTLIDPSAATDQNVDGTDEPDSEVPPAGLEVTVEIDSMRVSGNRAALSGTVTSTNAARYAGLRFILTVEDNGESGKSAVPDKVTWGVYHRQAERSPVDAENPDAGVYPAGEPDVDSQSFPLSSYTLSEIATGDIKVSP